MTPAGNELRRLQRIYHRILNSEKLIEFFNFQEQESRNFLFSLLDSPEKFQFECDRFAINVMLRAIYGVRLGNGEDNIVERAYKIWYIMYLCKTASSNPISLHQPDLLYHVSIHMSNPGALSNSFSAWYRTLRHFPSPAQPPFFSSAMAMACENNEKEGGRSTCPILREILS